ncbi:MAG: helix-turn-helix domain-containing protein [Puniceicoccaceae bacterium]
MIIPHRFSLTDPPILIRNPRNWSWSVRIPETYHNLWVLLEGSVRFKMEGIDLLASRPSYFFIPSSTQVSINSEGDAAPLNFSLHLDVGNYSQSDRNLLTEHRLLGSAVQDPDWFRVTALRSIQSVHRPNTFNHRHSLALAEALYFHFLRDQFAPSHNGRHEALLSLADSIRLDPAANWQVESCARKLGISRNIFHRRFLEVVGEAPRRFITRCRIDRAKQLLLESTMNVSEVALACGYQDVYFFSRHFKRLVGRSPSALRKVG